jgi:AraC family transcriptional regulator
VPRYIEERMAGSLERIQPVLAYAANHLEDNISLPELAGVARLSAFHLHRLFSSAAGETPKEFTLRLRLERAAVLLLAGGDSVLDVALCCGFQSHEVFCRAFRRRFGMAPRAYRQRGFVNGAHLAEHAAVVARVGPCVGLYRMEKDHKRMDQSSHTNYTVTITKLVPEPVLVARRRIERSAIAATIAEVLPKVFLYAQANGIALTGLPFARYSDVGHGLLTIEPGMRIAAGVAAGDGEVISDTLPGGPAAMTTHNGGYEKLSDAYAAIERYMKTENLVAAGAPWESYVTDPGEYPDPKDWKTEVFWPVQREGLREDTRGVS